MTANSLRWLCWPSRTCRRTRQACAERSNRVAAEGDLSASDECAEPGPTWGEPDDGTWIVTEIHSATTSGKHERRSAVLGHFYSQTTSALVAYDLPEARS